MLMAAYLTSANAASDWKPINKKNEIKSFDAIPGVRSPMLFRIGVLRLFQGPGDAIRRFFVSAYSKRLKDPRWQKKRLQIMERDEWKCLVCKSDKKTLTVHHTRYYKMPWDAPDRYLETLCEDCHGTVHVFWDLARAANGTQGLRSIDIYNALEQVWLECGRPTHEQLKAVCVDGLVGHQLVEYLVLKRLKVIPEDEENAVPAA